MWDIIFYEKPNGRCPVRFFHFYFDGQTIVITHGYQKKTNKVVDSEVDKAIEYRKDYLTSRRGQRR